MKNLIPLLVVCFCFAGNLAAQDGGGIANLPPTNLFPWPPTNPILISTVCEDCLSLIVDNCDEFDGTGEFEFYVVLSDMLGNDDSDIVSIEAVLENEITGTTEDIDVTFNEDNYLDMTTEGGCDEYIYKKVVTDVALQYESTYSLSGLIFYRGEDLMLGDDMMNNCDSDQGEEPQQGELKPFSFKTCERPERGEHDGLFGFNNSSNSEVAVYPNPFDQTILITNNNEEHRLVVSDLTGKILHDSTIDEDTKSATFDTSTFESGMYLMTVYSGKEITKVEKLIKL